MRLLRRLRHDQVRHVPGTGSLLAEGVTEFHESAATQRAGRARGQAHRVHQLPGLGHRIPDDFLQKLGDAEQAADDDYIGLFDEVKFPSRDRRRRGGRGRRKGRREADASPPTRPASPKTMAEAGPAPKPERPPSRATSAYSG